MDILFVIAYLGGILFYGIAQGSKIRNVRDFSVSTKKYGLFTVFASLSASFIGGGFCQGNATEVFNRGIGNIIALFGFSAGQILIGKYIIANAEIPENAASPGMVMRACYGRAGQITSGICSCLLNAGLLGAQVAAIGSMFNVLLHVPYSVGVLIGFAVILAYSTVGGIKAVIAAEIVEFLLLAVGLPLLLAFSVKYAGGYRGIAESIPRAHFDPFNGTSPVELLSLFLTMMIGEALTPAFVQRILIGRDRPTVARATVLSGVLSIPVFIITGCVGLCAYAVNPGLDPTLAMPMMVMRALPAGIKGLVISAMLAVVMSSADGCLSSASIGIVNDVIAPLSRKNLKGVTLLRIARVSNVVVGLGAMALALGTKNVFHILVLSYSAWSPMMLVPIASAILGIRAGKKSFAACAAGGALTSLVWTYCIGNPLGIGGTTAGFFAGLILFAAFSERKKHMFFK